MQAASDSVLRLDLPRSPALALGLAVEHLMGKPAFARLAFGEWSRVLVGQINRGHCRFVLDGGGRVQGFAGWALTDSAKAEAWISGRAPLSSRESLEGDCVILNAWSAASSEVHRFMLAELRKHFADKRQVYFRRHYKDGHTRSVRLLIDGPRRSHGAPAAAMTA